MTRFGLATAVVLALGCSGGGNEGGCSDSGNITFSLTPTGGSSEMKSYSCTRFVTFETTSFLTTEGASAENEADNASITLEGIPPPTGTISVTTSGQADFGFAYDAVEDPEGFATDCISGTLTSNGSVTVTAATVSSITGSFSFPSLCNGEDVTFTNVSGTFSYP